MALTPAKLEEIGEAMAREFHAGQMYDKQGYYDSAGVWHEPRTYVEGHLLPGVNLLRKMGYGPIYRTVFWLHDGPEDTGMTEQHMRNRCMPSEVIRPVMLMTKPKGYTDADEPGYLAGIAEDPVATVDKFVDASVNYANTVLMQPVVPDEKFFIRTARYARTIMFLGPLLPPPDELEVPEMWTPPGAGHTSVPWVPTGEQAS